MTDGRTMTHSALSSSCCGISSGTLRISFITVPAFCTLCSSFGRAPRGSPNIAIISTIERYLIAFTPSLDALASGDCRNLGHYSFAGADKWGNRGGSILGGAQVFLFALAHEMSDSPTDLVNRSAASVTRQLQLVFQLLGFLLGLLILEELVYG